MAFNILMRLKILIFTFTVACAGSPPPKSPPPPSLPSPRDAKPLLVLKGLVQKADWPGMSSLCGAQIIDVTLPEFGEEIQGPSSSKQETVEATTSNPSCRVGQTLETANTLRSTSDQPRKRAGRKEHPARIIGVLFATDLLWNFPPSERREENVFVLGIDGELLRPYFLSDGRGYDPKSRYHMAVPGKPNGGLDPFVLVDIARFGPSTDFFLESEGAQTALLVEIEINGGLGSRPGFAPVITKLRKVETTQRFPSEVASLVRQLRARFEDNLAVHRGAAQKQLHTERDRFLENVPFPDSKDLMKKHGLVGQALGPETENVTTVLDWDSSKEVLVVHFVWTQHAKAFGAEVFVGPWKSECEPCRPDAFDCAYCESGSSPAVIRRRVYESSISFGVDFRVNMSAELLAEQITLPLLQRTRHTDNISREP